MLGLVKSAGYWWRNAHGAAVRGLHRSLDSIRALRSVRVYFSRPDGSPSIEYVGFREGVVHTLSFWSGVAQGPLSRIALTAVYFYDPRRPPRTGLLWRTDGIGHHTFVDLDDFLAPSTGSGRIRG